MTQPTSTRYRAKQWLVLLVLILYSALPAFSASLNLVYEQVVKDSWGNEIGYRTVKLNSPSDLPAGSAWRNYLNLKMADGKTIYEYARDISGALAKNLNLTISDRDSNSYTSKGSSGYNLNLYNYINSFSSDSSKTFLFLHEFGHVAMLNGYPSTYDFSGLNYGTDGRHYIDEILPNENTAWVEGWGNAFAASKNNGMVFSFNLNDMSSLAFLKDSSFSDMAHNELFVAKVLYDSFNKITNGKSTVFNAISKTGPHYSLREFCQDYIGLYPANKAALTKILYENSQGKMSLNDILTYVNGGSRTVSRELYNYLAQAGLVASTTGTTTRPTTPTSTTTTTSTSTSSSNTSFWGRIASWFGGLFGGGANSPTVAKPSASVESTDSAAAGATATVPADSATAPELPGTSNSEFGSINDLGRAQELYYQYFAEYNRLMGSSGSTKQQVVEARSKMMQAKQRVKELRQSIK
ncbi:MAG: hypothetical protein PHV05_02815 [Candidatus Riflebacteria bacterium]|nr:hypothetical protein [Candidatus Riflebacteria bacterium]